MTSVRKNNLYSLARGKCLTPKFSHNVKRGNLGFWCCFFGVVLVLFGLLKKFTNFPLQESFAVLSSWICFPSL